VTDACAPHRPYLGAVADGEDELVPASTRAHLAVCAACSAELAAHMQLGGMLKSSALGEPGTHPEPTLVAPRHRILWPTAAAAAAVILVAGGGLVAWRATHATEDPVVVAVTAEHRTPSLQTSDPRAIASWCATNSDRRPPVVDLPSLEPSGARMDPVTGGSVVTIFYRASSGQTITIGWLDASSAPLTQTQASARTVDGQTVLVLTTAAGTAVIGGDVPVPQLWSTAGDLEAAGGQ
jgi:hypothetical protein